MNDIAYTLWKVKNESKFHLLDIDIYKKNNLRDSIDIKINFNFLKNNLKIKLNTADFFIKYLPSIYHFLDNSNGKLSSDYIQIYRNNTKNFDLLFKYRNEIKKFKNNNFKFLLKSDIYIELNLYKFIQEKIKSWKEFGVSPNLYLYDFIDIYNVFNNIIIPYKIEGDTKYNNFSLLKLFACTNFSKYFFKANPEFKI